MGTTTGKVKPSICSGCKADIGTLNDGCGNYFCARCAKARKIAKPLRRVTRQKTSGVMAHLGPIAAVIGLTVVGGALWVSHAKEAVRDHIAEMKAAADAQLSAGDASGASEQYASILRYIDENGGDDSARAAAQQQKQIADSEVVQQAASAEATAQQQAAAQRQAAAQQELQREKEQEQLQKEAIANAPCTIKGTAWLKLADGSNADQRGMKIYVLNPTMTQDQYGPIYQQLMNDLASESQALQNQRAGTHDDDPIKNADDNALSAISKLTDQLQSEAQQSTLPIQKVFLSVRAAEGLKDIHFDFSASVLHSIDPSLSPGPRSPLDIISRDDIWPKLVQAALLGTAETDADARYAINVQKGQYVFYAISANVNFCAEWLLAVDGTNPGDQEINLFNDNASITSK